ncbi:MAG: hypothetical protein WC663_06040 [Patescibacteria group bacterium]|jgi:glutathione synthase/RimK-type ligase-like ATP-grasp enzyme
MSKKKVAIFLLSIDNSTKKQTGFLSKEEVLKIEEKLKQNSEIEFLGNVNFNNLKVLNTDFWCDNVNLSKCDLFFWYAPGRNINEYKALSKVIKVIKNPESLELINDKFKTHVTLKEKGLPIADFALIPYDDLETMKKILNDWKEILVKPRFGSFGRGIIKVKDFETLRDIAGMLKSYGQNKIFVEKFYENDKKAWISTTLINGKIVYGYRKKEEKFADWKVYDVKGAGGGAYYVDPSPVKDYAEKAAEILDKSIVGFDFIKTADGYKIVDENNFPGFYPEAFKEAHKNVSDLIVELILENL